MTKIKPKLYLNMSPQTQEEGSLAFARNMKVDDDGNLVSDYGYNNINAMVGHTIVGHIVGLNNKIYFFCEDKTEDENQNTVVTYNIIEYDEINNSATTLNTGWQYRGGKITGCVNTNQSGELILTVCEYDATNNTNVPIKHINLSHCTSNDNESIYTQAPEVPTANLILQSTYIETIPSGVYVFFIRYKIRKDVYTNWFLCSRPVFAGTSETTTTIQGGLKYINTHKDSAKSFIFNLGFVGNEAITLYDECQLGFIITHDDATDARIWKSFEIPSNGSLSIYFNYYDVKEANIDDFLSNTYDLYNVRNITNFKNKLYISNYKESNFNPNLSNINLDNIFSLAAKKINEENAQGYADVDISINNSFKKLLEYTTDKPYDYYTKIETSGSSSALINTLTSDVIKSLLTVDISDFYKVESSEFEDAFVFDMHGHVDQNPDIIYIAGFANSLYGHYILGNDFTLRYNSAGHGWGDVGLSLNPLTDYPGVYLISAYSTAHPLHGKLTYGYGVFGETEVPSSYLPYATWNTIPINSSTIGSNKAVAGAGFLTDEIRNTIVRELKKEITKLDRFILGYATITSGAKVYNLEIVTTKDIFDKNNYAGFTNDTDYGIENKNNSNDTYIKEALINQLSSFIHDKIVGIDDNGNIILKIGEDYIKSSAIEFSFKACEFVLDGGDNVNKNNDENYNVRFSATLKSTIYKCICTFGIDDTKINVTPKETTDPKYKQASTMIPLSTYKAYIHFVDKHNIITNGYPLSSLITTGVNSHNLTKFILKYSVDASKLGNLTNTYRSFFVSLKNVGDIIIETFGNTYRNGYNIVQCLEADALLYNINDGITLVKGDVNVDPITTSAKYYSSGESIPSISFGNCGFIAWKGAQVNDRLYVKISRNTEDNKPEKGLIKATPYLRLQAATNIEVADGFYGGYFCSVKKPSFSLSSTCYVSGNDVYSALRGAVIKLNDFEGFINTQDSNIYFLRSNYNLNYLTLVEDISDHIHKTGSTSTSVKQVVKVINSAMLSSIYTLKGMYKDFMNKTFTAYEEDNKIQFDNTVRVSNTLSDETFNNSVFKFEATNYYNIPTDRGIIVNLFAIGNIIFAHCKQSLFKFDGNQTIIASDTDIKLQESEPFDIGISQVFDSQYGYGGIDNKEAGCITFDSYVFYDRFSNHIFAYGGNNQIQQIDGSIYKFLKHYNFTECYTLHDEINHRILFDFKKASNKRICISYNYKTKSFISTHDIILEKAFASRNKCYSYYDTICDLFYSSNIPTTVLNSNLNLIKLYGGASYVCTLFFGTNKHSLPPTCFNIAVVLPVEENIREVINNIKYIGDVVKNYIANRVSTNPEDSEDQDSYDLILNEEHTSYNQGLAENPVHSVYIITDSCVSNIITGTINDTDRPEALTIDDKEYQKIRHDIDSWNVNYFRNILHSKNVYDYANQPRINQPVNSCNNSLVYGKYFIIVFNFITTKQIKMEELFISTSKY